MHACAGLLRSLCRCSCAVSVCVGCGECRGKACLCRCTQRLSSSPRFIASLQPAPARAARVIRLTLLAVSPTAAQGLAPAAPEQADAPSSAVPVQAFVLLPAFEVDPPSEDMKRPETLSDKLWRSVARRVSTGLSR